MWAKFINEDYIIPAPEKAGGVEDFNKRPDIMKQFDYKEIVNAPGFDPNKPVKYRLKAIFIEQYNPEIQEQEELSQAEKVLTQRDFFLQIFSGIRENSGVTESSTDGVFVSKENERAALLDYTKYLKNIEAEPGFPDIQVLGFGDWLNTQTKFK